MVIRDVIVIGRNTKEHFQNLERVLQILQESGIRTQTAKCKYFQKRVKYLSHVIGKTGVIALSEHVEAIRCMPLPENAKELRAFLGAVNYYSRFLPNLQQENVQGAERNNELKCKMNFLIGTIKKKDSEINNLLVEEERLRQQVSMVEQTFKEREEQLKDAYQNITCQLAKKDEELRILADATKIEVQAEQSKAIVLLREEKDAEVQKLTIKLKDMQTVLTAEIADKYDEIRRLKDDIKELEDKLRQSEKQTHFRDDLIKELRKEVKHGRAKESLAEMLGLKGTPRAAMETKIDNLTSQIEELKWHNTSLESRLAECNLPAVLALRSRLNQAEGSLLAMCNKIDYVRKYLENLKGDEELSLKCGIEALLNELREDVEWNKQTRRNLSQDESSSVIVINHRSRSLPDNSLHRRPLKTMSESAVLPALNKPHYSPYVPPQETLQDCKLHIQTINDLENNFVDTNRAVSDTWNSLKLWSEGSGDTLARTFVEIICLSAEGNEELTKLATQVGSLLDYKVDEEGSHNLEYLQGNLIELDHVLTKAKLVEPSDSELFKESERGDELGVLGKRMSMIISDSLSLLHEPKQKNFSQIPMDFKNCIKDIMVQFSSIIGNKKTVFEKLVSLQKQQIHFFQTLVGRVSEFDKGLSSFNESSENLKGEVRKLFSALLTKESQLQKQHDELEYLKTLLASTTMTDNKNNESSSLRKVVSSKDLKVQSDKEELIHNLRSLNYTLRRTKVSKSTSSINCSENESGDVDGRFQELEEAVVAIKGNLSCILKYLVKNQDMMSEFEDNARSLVQALVETHKEIMMYKDAITDGKEDNFNIDALDAHLNEAALKVEQLLNAVEVFLCDGDKPNLRLISENLRKKMTQLVNVRDFIKKTTIHEHSLLKSISEENEDLIKQMKTLEEQLTEQAKNNQNHSENESLIQNLNKSLEKANADLQAIHEEYAKLKIEKEDMETKNQKVMEELQAKVCALQESASRARQTEAFKKPDLETVLLEREDELCKIKNEFDEMKNSIEELRRENCSLLHKINEYLQLIQALQQELEEQKIQDENLIKHLENLENLSEFQKKELEHRSEELLSYIEKIDEMKVTDAVQRANCERLTQELEILREEKLNIESSIMIIQDELLKRSEEVKQTQLICNKHLGNLAKYVEENNTLHLQHEDDEKLKLKLEYEFYKLQEELKANQEREMQINSELIEKRQTIYQLKIEKEKLVSYNRDLEILLKERNSAFAGGDGYKGVIENQLEIIEVLRARLNQMSQYIAERDEIIKLIETQLQASTEFMLVDSDKEVSIQDVNKPDISLSRRLSAYKQKLEHAMQQNWRLVNMVNKLQNINYSIIRDQGLLRKGSIESFNGEESF